MDHPQGWLRNYESSMNRASIVHLLEGMTECN